MISLDSENQPTHRTPRKPDPFSDRLVLGIADEFGEMEANLSELTSVEQSKVGLQLDRLLKFCYLYWSCDSVSTGQLELIATALLTAEPFTGEFLNATIRLEVYSKALEVAKESNDSFAIARFAKMLGIALCEKGRTEEGLKRLNNALDLVVATENEPEEVADILAAMAEGFTDLGNWEMAKKHASEAIAKIEPDNPVLSGHWDAFGSMAHQFGKTEEARLYYNKAIEIAKFNNRDDEVAMASANLARIYAEEGLFEDAIRLNSVALKIARQQALQANTQLESPFANQRSFLLAEMFTRLLNMGRTFAEIGNFDDALDCMKEAVEIARDDLKDPTRVAEASLELAECHFETGQNLKALAAVKTAQTIYTSKRDEAGHTLTLLVEGLILINQDRCKEAIGLLQEAKIQATSINDTNLVASAQFHLAMARFGLGNRERALIAVEDAVKICVDGKKPMLEDILEWVSEKFSSEIALEIRQRAQSTKRQGK